MTKRRSKIMYKPKTLTEKICRWTLYAMLFALATFTWYARHKIHPEMTNPQFTNWIWSEKYFGVSYGMWFIMYSLTLLFLYVRSNLTAFRNMMQRPVENEQQQQQQQQEEEVG